MECEIRGMKGQFLFNALTPALLFSFLMITGMAWSQDTPSVPSIDSSYFTLWAANDTLTSGYLDGIELDAVYGYAGITEIDVERGKKGNLLRVESRSSIYPNRIILHCVGDSIDRVRLSPEDVHDLIKILNDPTNFSEEVVMCIFLPRHTFTFIDPDNQMVGAVELCFECGQISVWPDHIQRAGRTTLSRKGLDEMETLCEREGLFPPCVRAACTMYFMDNR